MQRTSHHQESVSPAARTALAVILLALGLGTLAAAPAAPDFVPQTALFVPDPGFAEIGAKPEPLPVSELIDAALLASGASAERSSAYKESLESHLAELKAAAGDIVDPGERAEAVLGFLHKRILGVYVEDATTLDGILDTGRFNCVSSAVLYLIAARSLGLEVYGVRTTDHAFCLVRLPGRDVDVETTNPQGFDPGTKKEFKNSFGRVTGFAYVPPGDYGRRKTIGEKALVGLILSNRASLLERSGRYQESLRIGVDFDALGRDRDSRSFLLDRVNNLEADLSRRRNFTEAEALAAAARAALGEEPRLVELARVAAYNRAASLAEANRWDDALDAAAAIAASGAALPELGALIEAALGNLVNGYIQKDDFDGARRALEGRRQLAGAAAADNIGKRIGEAELAAAIRDLPFAEAEAAADRSFAAGHVGKSLWTEAIVVLYGNEANRIAGAGDLLKAADLAEDGARKIPGDENLPRLAATLRRNFVALAHNHFAALFNGRDYAGAETSIENALAQLPGDRTLLDDLAMAKRAQAQ